MFRSILLLVLAVTSTFRCDILQTLNDIKKEISVLEDDFQDNSKRGIDEEIRRKNAEIIKKYLALPEIMPDLFGVNRTDTIKHLIKMKKKALRRRKHHFHKTCGRRYTILERWLQRQLRSVQRQAMKKYHNNCTKVKSDNPVTSFSTNELRDITWKMATGKRQNSLEAKDTIVNHQQKDSSSQGCVEKGVPDIDGSVTMCAECFVTTDLGERIFPRYVNEVHCGHRTVKDYFCLFNEGLCIENIIYVTFLFDENNVGLNRLFEWTQYRQSISTSCSCQILRDSFFRSFL